MVKTYIYRREDTDELIEVPFSVMIEQEAGFITLPDGVSARRCLHLEIERDGKPERQKMAPACDREIVSDTLGFGQHQLDDFERDRQQHGFTGVEFIPDRDVPEFRRVKCSSQKEFERYLSHRGYVNQTGLGGVRLTQEDLDRAADLVTRHLSVGGK